MVSIASLAEVEVDCVVLLQPRAGVHGPAAPGGVPVGTACATHEVAGLHCRLLVHGTVPLWNEAQPRTSVALLQSAVRDALRCARECGCCSVALVSSGVHGFPTHLYAHTTIQEISKGLLQDCRILLGEQEWTSYLLAALRVRPLHHWSASDVATWAALAVPERAHLCAGRSGASLAVLDGTEWVAMFPSVDRSELLRQLSTEGLCADVPQADDEQDSISLRLLQLIPAGQVAGCGVLYMERDGVVCAVREMTGRHRGR